MREESGEVGIGGLIINDEPCVDGNRAAARQRSLHRVSMAPEALVRLVYDDLPRFRKEPCGGKTGRARTNDRHAPALPALRPDV